jgi:hypothetical protein
MNLYRYTEVKIREVLAVNATDGGPAEGRGTLREQADREAARAGGAAAAAALQKAATAGVVGKKFMKSGGAGGGFVAMDEHPLSYAGGGDVNSLSKAGLYKLNKVVEP